MNRSSQALRSSFIPRPIGIFILLIIILAFTAGALRQEWALMLAGAVFLALWLYCLILTLLLALIHRRRARRAFIRISPREIIAGGLAAGSGTASSITEAVYSEGETAASKSKILQLPGILVRCRLLLATKDGRRIRYDFNPAISAPHFFTVKKRGAYFSAYDEFAVFDILGFFRFAFRLPAESGARLLASPRAADEPPAVNARAGESMLKPEFSLQRTDNFIDHRPYVPGDDPRRINWKLFSHGGGLFVREGEHEPPPQSNLIILIDTEYDPLLYSKPEARRGIDMLCETALAAALACVESGMDVLTGYSGIAGQTGGDRQAVGDKQVVGAIRGGTAAELAASLAWPAASPLSAAGDLPAAPGNCGILILTLPRSGAENSSLDRFLNNTAHRRSGDNAQTIEILFLYDNAAARSEHLAAAEVCAALYNQRPGVRARLL
jgi:hypothetical protein